MRVVLVVFTAAVVVCCVKQQNTARPKTPHSNRHTPIKTTTTRTTQVKGFVFVQTPRRTKKFRTTGVVVDDALQTHAAASY